MGNTMLIEPARPQAGEMPGCVVTAPAVGIAVGFISRAEGTLMSVANAAIICPVEEPQRY